MKEDYALKTLIAYFSQTGNTLKIAECIRDGIVEAKGPCDSLKRSPVLKPKRISGPYFRKGSLPGSSYNRFRRSSRPVAPSTHQVVLRCDHGTPPYL